jgi:hypothetical protein
VPWAQTGNLSWPSVVRQEAATFTLGRNVCPHRATPQTGDRNARSWVLAAIAPEHADDARLVDGDGRHMRSCRAWRRSIVADDNRIRPCAAFVTRICQKDLTPLGALIAPDDIQAILEGSTAGIHRE